MSFREDLLKFIEKLKNKNGKLEGQRLKESWLIKNNYQKEYNFLRENDLLNSQKIYNYINNEDGTCECGSEKRFIGYSSGYKEYCEKCSRTKYNYMKQQGNIDLELDKIIEFIKDKNNNYNSSKIKKLSEKTINLLIERTKYLDEKSKISERLYHLENNINGLPICKVCGKQHNNYKFSENGYNEYCSITCSNKDSLEKRRKSMLYNKYNIIIKKFLDLPKDYEIELFDKEDYINDKECSVKIKHLKCNHEYERDKKYQGHLKCPKCYPIRSKIQYEIYEWLKEYNSCKFNDRQLIKPKEIDIVCENFAIEYDSLMFHSYGKSSDIKFNNTIEDNFCHLEKTELVEEQGIQLFRIFSNEWLNKEEIWKSILNSKIGSTERIYARKCNIKEVSSNEAKEFCENNHLQGYINSSIRIGLYYNNELVSLMTFGKTRRSKWAGENNFELYRYCSKLNSTIIGGASKLLKFFEKNYECNLLISYANRRWSVGNVYEKLGFKFIENTIPNYFYFKGGDSSTLQSREQFQKHKLKDKLEIFDEKLTETENMFNNGYRKIYDSGNKVYVKQY